MANFNLDNYEPVEERLQRYLEKYPDARFITKVESNDGTRILIKAAVYQNAEQLKENLPHATGYAEEVRGEGYVNKTSHVENCETSAIGRALANAGYSGNKDKASRASREEMEKVQRMSEPERKPDQVSSPCPTCGGETEWRGGKKPDGTDWQGLFCKSGDKTHKVIWL